MFIPVYSTNCSLLDTIMKESHGVFFTCYPNKL